MPWSHTTAHSLNKTFIECFPQARRQNQVVDNKNPKGFSCPRGASSLVGVGWGRPYRRPVSLEGSVWQLGLGKERGHSRLLGGNKISVEKWQIAKVNGRKGIKEARATVSVYRRLGPRACE